jgi:ferritin
MLDPKIAAALNEQIQHELASAYLYLAMAAYFEAGNLPGSAQWMRRQAKEEVGHAMKFYDYVNDRDGRVTLAALPAPRAEYASPVEVWEQTLAHEQKVTGLIHRLVGMAQDAGDHATRAMLQWFVTEQVEEEKTARTILEQAQKIGTTSSAIFFFDRHLGKEAEKED